MSGPNGNNSTEYHNYGTFTDSNENGRLDTGEKFTDLNGNNSHDFGEPFTDSNSNNMYDFGESYTDANTNNMYDPGEPFQDIVQFGLFDFANNNHYNNSSYIANFDSFSELPGQNSGQWLKNENFMIQDGGKTFLERTWISPAFSDKIDIVADHHLLLMSGALEHNPINQQQP
jgi:hypothetical protein